jgi:electron transport complex protein RnfA
MSALLILLLGAVLITIVVIEHIPNWRPFLACDDVFAAARGVAIATAIAMLPLAVIAYGLTHAVLAPLGLGYLRTFAFVALTLAIAPLAELASRRVLPLVPARPAFHVLLIGNGALLGVALTIDARARDVIDVLALALACALAFGFMLLALAAMLERVRQADIPRSFRYAPIAALTAGLAALAFMGFAGLIQE